MYDLDEIIVTEYNEVMTYSESLQHGEIVERTATEDECDEYISECNALRKQAEEFDHESYYHRLD